jgi:hypothetical protein
MEYKGIQYQVVQTANPTGFKWTVHIAGRPLKTGIARSRELAIRLAEIAIDGAIRVKPSKPPLKQ